MFTEVSDMEYTDTIAAIATASGESGIGIVRVSGDEAVEIVDKIFRPGKSAKKDGKNKTLAKAESHTIHYGYIYSGEEPLDEVLVTLMRAPRSYTAEDTVEINCHGGVLVTRRVLETVIAAGARLAEPGEFTKRAFLNGRIDLAEAEAVADIINSDNDLALAASEKQLRGSVSEKIRELREKILYELAYIESALDDPEHYSLDGYPEKLRGVINELESELRALIKSSENGRVIREGIKTVILGKPNVGKSTLLNLLVGSDRAIVTDIAGTTRDTLEERVLLDGISLNIVDTAGIRKAGNVVEEIGISRALDAAKEANLIICLIDSSVPLDENDLEILDFIKGRKAIILLNKCDLEPATEICDLDTLTECPVITFSAKEETGLSELTDMIRDMFFNGEISFNDEVLITNVRHVAALKDALGSIEHVEESIDMNIPEDFYSIDLMAAYSSLGTIIGEAVEDDLVNMIFEKFCMGK